MSEMTEVLKAVSWIEIGAIFTEEQIESLHGKWLLITIDDIIVGGGLAVELGIVERWSSTGLEWATAHRGLYALDAGDLYECIKHTCVASARANAEVLQIAVNSEQALRAFAEGGDHEGEE